MTVPTLLLSALASLPLSPASHDPCGHSAIALRECGLQAAKADLWRAVAMALDEERGNTMRLLGEAVCEYAESMAETEWRYQMRLQVCVALGPGAYDPQLDPSEFTTQIDNPWFPTLPGRTWVWEQQGREGLERIEARVLYRTVDIEGVTCRVIRVRETLNGDLTEITDDWYAQHTNGDVWYFGELSQHFEDGFLADLEGSWRAGKDGAEAGVQMMAAPSANLTCRKEYLVDEAEDIITVISRNATVTTARGTFTNCIQLEEWSPLENEREMKYFAPGIGLVLEVDLQTGERLELISYSP